MRALETRICVHVSHEKWSRVGDVIISLPTETSRRNKLQDINFYYHEDLLKVSTFIMTALQFQ